jgi:BMFP domain-containing protein YqiC
MTGSPLWGAYFKPTKAEPAMTQTSNRFFDEMARLMNDAAGVAQGVRREFDTLFRAQAERILRELDVVQREDFEAVKDMARLAREENEALKARLEALEAKVAGKAAAKTKSVSDAPPAAPDSTEPPSIPPLGK